MRQKLTLTVLAGFVMVMLTGCHLTHDWQEATCTTPRTCLKGGETQGEALGHTWIEATCTEPKTCSVCGETEGEALGHTWIEATCTEPKTCSVCKETEGEALGHTLTEANYQQAATCQICEETVGEPLQADFEKYDLSYVSADLDVAYPYEAPCYENPDYTTVGSVTFSDYETFTSDDTHEALDGYEWKAVNITFRFFDDNAWNYGYGYNYFCYDYYNMNNGGTINYNGTDYPDVKLSHDNLSKEWNGHESTEVIREYTLVPIGYDGIMITPCHPKYSDITNVTTSEKVTTIFSDGPIVSFRME